MQTIHIRVLLTCPCGTLRYPVPLFDQLLQIVCYVLLELADAFGAESVRDSLPLSCVLSSISGVEETSLDRDEGIVIVTVKDSPVSKLKLIKAALLGKPLETCLPLQPTTRQTVDDRDSLWICHTHMIRLYPHQGSISLVCLINS